MADRLVEAARRIIIRDGFAGLTFQSIEAEAGASRSLIHYHFGGKMGLLLAVVDTIFKDLDGAYDPPTTGDMPARLFTELESDRKLSADSSTMLLFVELLPHMLRTKELRERLQTYYRRGRREDDAAQSVASDAGGEQSAEELRRARHQQHHVTFMRSLAAEYGQEPAESVGALMPAMIDGLGLQLLIDPEEVDHAQRYRVWRDMVLTYLEAQRIRRARE